MNAPFTIANFWPRVGASILDGLLLGVIGFVLGIALEDFFVSIGNYGALFGMAISVGYQTVFNSRLMNGQTLGKKILKLQVADINGDTIAIDKALMRSLALSVPFFLTNVPIPGIPDLAPANIIKALVLIIWGIGIVVVYIFNTQTRQSLHDLAVGTFVITLERKPETAPLPPMTGTPFIVFGGVSVLLIGISIYFYSSSTKFDEILTIQNKISKVDGVIKAGVVERTSYGPTQRESFEAKIWVQNVPDVNFTDDKTVREVISIVLHDVPNIDRYNAINIITTREFNIGIASRKTSKWVSKSPGDWRELVNK